MLILMVVQDLATGSVEIALDSENASSRLYIHIVPVGSFHALNSKPLRSPDVEFLFAIEIDGKLFTTTIPLNFYLS
jgi:hypothetical protein